MLLLIMLAAGEAVQVHQQQQQEDMNDSSSSVSCSGCLEPPPDAILRMPPPPLPDFLVHTSSNYYTEVVDSNQTAGGGGGEDLSVLEHLRPACKYSCTGAAEWRINDEGSHHHVEIPQQGSIFGDTWLVILICASVGVIFIGIILATLMIRCKFNQNVDQTNDGASQCSNRSNKNSTLSTSTASSSIQTTTTTSGSGIGCSSSSGVSGSYIINNKSIVRLQNEAILYGSGNGEQDSRVMWATLTPRGTTRHYLEDHTYETINENLPPPPPPPPLPTYAEVGYLHRRPSEHVDLKAIPTIYLSYHTPDTYHDPPAPAPIVTRPKDEKAFDNTAFVDYEDPLSLKNEYYQLEDVLEPCDQIFSVQGLYGLPPSGASSGGSVRTLVRPRVSSPTRIEHPNLPPLNQRKKQQRKSHHHHHHHHHHHQQHHTLGRGGTGGSNHTSASTTTTTSSGSATSYVPTI